MLQQPGDKKMILICLSVIRVQTEDGARPVVMEMVQLLSRKLSLEVRSRDNRL